MIFQENQNAFGGSNSARFANFSREERCLQDVVNVSADVLRNLYHFKLLLSSVSMRPFYFDLFEIAFKFEHSISNWTGNRAGLTAAFGPDGSE